MNKVQSFIVVAVLVVVVAAAFIYKDTFAPPVAQVADQAYQVSFLCDDTTHFIAHFTNSNTVQIDVDGTIVRELPHATSTSGTLYADSDWSLALRGETATVTRMLDNKSGACHQPFDPNLAPYNWGD